MARIQWERAAKAAKKLQGITDGVTEPTTPTPPAVPPLTMPTLAMPEAPTPPTLPEVPTLTPPVIPEVPTVPPYEKSAEQIAFEQPYGEELKDWREAGGYGIPEETQAQMIQQTTDILKARETEALRVNQNTMERRGITNSGFVFYNEQQIKSSTTMAIAESIRDVQIRSALIKLASFEKAMGATAQFIGYLAEESSKAYAPKMAQWGMEAQYGLAEYEVGAQYGLSQAELEARYGLAEYGMKGQYGIAGYQAQVQATIAQFQVNAQAVINEWQAGFDLIKMDLNQAYAVGNMDLAAQIAATAAEQQNIYNIEMAEMEIEAAEEAAKAEAGGSISGSIVNGIFAVATAVI